MNAMMDISDGLATDLRHVLKQSGVGAELHGHEVPMLGTLNQALFDGEDFELLLSVAPENVTALQAEWNQRFEATLPVVGNMTGNADELLLDSGLIENKAFEHFSAD